MSKVKELLAESRTVENEDALIKLCRSNYPAVALEVARSKHATPRVLDSLTRHPSITVRHAVAMNSNTSKETLSRLGEDKDQLVRDYAKRTLQETSTSK